jgi:uncharacterized membrane protein HdeD (DUF308 family)
VQLNVGRPAASDAAHLPADEPLVFHAPWQATLACGLLKIFLAVAAVALPLLEGRHLASSVGWMLIAGGTAEFMLGWSAHRSELRRVTLGSGILTMLAGLLFVTSDWTELTPLASVVIIWLLLRGLISLEMSVLSGRAINNDSIWLLARGLVDLSLGLLLLANVPIAVILIIIFGVTSDLITTFGAALSISFLIAGVGLIAISMSQRNCEAAK